MATNPPTVDPIKAHMLREMRRKTTELKDAFEQVADENVRSVPEAIFIRDFLPLFAGVSTDNRENLLDAWRLISGTPFIPVNVVDIAGQKVIQVPPLSVAPEFLIGKIGQPTLSARVDEAASLSQISPRAADGALINALVDRVKQTPVPTEASIQWQAVFDHYKEYLPKKTGESSGNTDEDSGSIFEM